jgi:hypothetical protein
MRDAEPKEVTYAMLAKHLGAETANLLCITRRKDGIGIEEPVCGLKTLIAECTAPADGQRQGESR